MLDLPLLSLLVVASLFTLVATMTVFANDHNLTKLRENDGNMIPILCLIQRISHSDSSTQCQFITRSPSWPQGSGIKFLGSRWRYFRRRTFIPLVSGCRRLPAVRPRRPLGISKGRKLFFSLNNQVSVNISYSLSWQVFVFVQCR